MQSTTSQKRALQRQADKAAFDERQKVDVYQVVTDRIIAKLEQGEIPWKHFALHPLQAPMNLVSKKPYRGMNFFLLQCNQYKSPYWLTYKQCAALGGQVRKGEKSTPVTFWKKLESKDQVTVKGEPKQFMMARYYNVFNTDQCDGLDVKAILELNEVRDDTDPLASAEEIIENYPNHPEYIYSDAPRAYYDPSDDKIHMLERSRCKGDAEFYTTMFHEMIHSTGHKSRLDRGIASGILTSKGSYAAEELTAEMGAAMLAAEARIFEEVLDNAASYIQGWLKALKDDRKMLMQAAAKAQKAVTHILNRETAKTEE